LGPYDFRGGKDSGCNDLLESLGFMVKRKPRSISAVSKYWALVCDPDVYEGRAAACELDLDTWTVPRGDLRPGDRALIWQAAGRRRAERGVVGVADVLSAPDVRDELPESRRFWVGTPKPDERRVVIRYSRSSRLPLWVKDHPVLADLSVAKARGGTVFRIDEAQWSKINNAFLGLPSAEESADYEDAARTAAETANRRATGQGFGASPAANRKVEEHAVERARKHFENRGFTVVEHGKPFDLEATKDGKTIFVEVKGTTTDGHTVFLTRNEVDYFRAYHPNTALFIVSGIELSGTEEAPVAHGGVELKFEPWSPADGDLEVLTWRYTVPR
jgi:hypothetical protein